MSESRIDPAIGFARERAIHVKEKRLKEVTREVYELAGAIAHQEIVLGIPREFLGDLYDRENTAIALMMELRDDLGLDGV